MDDNNQYSETPATPPSEQTPYTPPKKTRSSRPLMIVLLCVIIAVLAGAAGALGYKYLYPQKAASTVSEIKTSATTPVSTSSDANSLINGLKPQLKSAVVPTEIDGNNNVVVTGTVYGVDGVPSQKPTGSNFFTTPTVFPRVTVASNNSDTLMTDIKTTEAYFLDQHMQLDTVNYSGTNSGITAQFHNATTVCSLSQTTEPWPQGNNQLTVNCADANAYQSQAATLAPLYAAYTAAQPDVKTEIGTTFTGSIVPSQTKGYHTASINTGGAFNLAGGSAALFYQTPNGTWHYFQNTQSILSCDAFKTGDIQKAFVGTPCATANGQESKVSA